MSSGLIGSGSSTLGPRPTEGELLVGGPGARPRPIEGNAPVAQRHVRVVADHQVVEQLDVEQAARGECLGRQVQVVRRGRA